jgi:hypothetical protein
MEALISSETSVLTRAIGRNIPEDAIFHSHRRENLKSYNREVDLETPVRNQSYKDLEEAEARILLTNSTAVSPTGCFSPLDIYCG